MTPHHSKADDLRFVGEHTERLSALAVARYRQQGRGLVVAVRTGDYLQLALYVAVHEARRYVYDEAAMIRAVAEAVGHYDPARTFVMLLADSMTGEVTCWVVPHPPGDVPAPPACVARLAGIPE